MNTRFIVPGFLRKLDELLLYHAPNLWRSRLTYFIFYGLLIGLPAAYIGCSNYAPERGQEDMVGFTIPFFVLLMVIFFWYTFQRQQAPDLGGGGAFFRILAVFCLNILCVLILFGILAYFGYEVYEAEAIYYRNRYANSSYNSLDGFYTSFGALFATLLLPMAAIPLFIRSLSLMDAMLSLVYGFFYFFGLGFLLDLLTGYELLFFDILLLYSLLVVAYLFNRLQKYQTYIFFVLILTTAGMINAITVGMAKGRHDINHPFEEGDQYLEVFLVAFVFSILVYTFFLWRHYRRSLRPQRVK